MGKIKRRAAVVLLGGHRLARAVVVRHLDPLHATLAHRSGHEAIDLLAQVRRSAGEAVPQVIDLGGSHGRVHRLDLLDLLVRDALITRK